MNFIDMLAAASYLAAAVEPWVAAIVFVTIGSYIPLTIFVTEWRGGFRRAMNTTANAAGARVTDALLNWETVKYFTAEGLEQERYAEVSLFVVVRGFGFVHVCVGGRVHSKRR